MWDIAVLEAPVSSQPCLKACAGYQVTGSYLVLCEWELLLDGLLDSSPFSSLVPTGASSNSLSLLCFPLLVSSVNSSVMGIHKCLYLPSALQH